MWWVYGGKQLTCFGEDTDTGTGCRMDLKNAQLWAAIGGLVSTALVWATHHRHYVLAVIAFVAVLHCFLGWGILDDSAVHGWGNLKVFRVMPGGQEPPRYRRDRRREVSFVGKDEGNRSR